MQGETLKFTGKRFVNRLLNLLYPETGRCCLLCHRPIPDQQAHHHETAHAEMSGVCLFCLQDIENLNHPIRIRRISIDARVPRVVTTGGLNGASPPGNPNKHVMSVIGATTHHGIMRTAIRSWKYDGATDLTLWFARLTYQTLTTVHRHLSGVESPDLPYDWIVPIPTSMERLKSRGYHQTLLLANGLAKLTSIPVLEALVRRSQRSERAEFMTQTNKNAAERLRGLQGVYQLRSAADDRFTVQNQHVLLVDDVMTTGATLLTCAKALYTGGARHVDGLVIAHVD